MSSAIKLYYEDGLIGYLPGDEEEEVAKQMSRPQKKRSYIYGVEFSAVKSADKVLHLDTNPEHDEILYHIDPRLKS